MNYFAILTILILSSTAFAHDTIEEAMNNGAIDYELLALTIAFLGFTWATYVKRESKSMFYPAATVLTGLVIFAIIVLQAMA